MNAETVILLATEPRFAQFRELAGKIVDQVYTKNCDNLIQRVEDAPELSEDFNMLRAILESSYIQDIPRTNQDLYRLISGMASFQIRRSL